MGPSSSLANQEIKFKKKMKIFALLAVFSGANALDCLTRNSESWADCLANGVATTCNSNQEVCQVHERKRAGAVYRVQSGCKQKQACVNNKKHNFVNADLAYSQMDHCQPDATGKDSQSVCRQCCNDTADANCAMALQTAVRADWDTNKVTV